MAFGKGEGRGGRYFRGSQKFGMALAKKLARKVASDTVPYSERAVDCSRQTFSRKPYTYYTWTMLRDICTASHTVGDNKLSAIYLIYRLDHLNYVINGVTATKDGV